MTWLLNYLQTVIVNTFITTYNSLMLKYRMKIYTLGWGLFTLLFYCSTDRNICYWKSLNSCQFSWFSWSVKNFSVVFLKLIYNISKDNIEYILSNYSLKAIKAIDKLKTKQVENISKFIVDEYLEWGNRRLLFIKGET